MAPGPPDSYRTLAGEAVTELEERRSRFVARVAPAPDETTALAAIDQVRDRSPDATHHCWAWRVGLEPRERCSDAGEPAGTAGEPILRVLRGRELVGVVVVVSRWFGGVKLGRGGLARAYATVAAEALDGARIVRRVATARVEVEVPFERLGAARSALEQHGASVVAETWGARGVRWTVRVPRLDLAAVSERLRSLRLAPKEPDR